MYRRPPFVSRVLVVAAVAALALLLSACTAGTTPADKTGELPISELRTPMTSFLATSYYRQVINWESCDTHLQCGDVAVPIDWQHPTGDSVEVSIIRHRATGKRLGALLVDPGGPGDSGTELVDDGVDNAVDATVAKHYDVIGVDPRGVGLSTPVKCLNDKQQDAYLYAPTVGAVGSKGWIADERKRATTLADACDHNTGPLIAHIDTVSAAHDLDVIRAALGEKKLNYLGYSYGTYLGTVYAGLYPQNVGRMVFDGPYNPWEDSGGSGIDDSQAVGFDDDLKAFLRACLAESAEAVGHSTCPMTGTLANAEKTVEGLLASADAHPIPDSDGRVLDGATLATGISDALYDTSEWPKLSEAFTQVIAGNAKEAFALADEYNDRASDGTYDDNAAAAFTAISCLEDGHAVDLKFDARELAKLKKDAPMMGQYNAYEDIPCSGWKYGPTAFPEPIHASKAGPILMVATTGDPATPYGDAKDLAEQLVTSHLVTYHGEGHTAYDLGHACVDQAVDDYLDSGIVPKSDPECRD